MLRSWSKCILIIYSPRDAGGDAGSQPSLKEEMCRGTCPATWSWGGHQPCPAAVQNFPWVILIHKLQQPRWSHGRSGNSSTKGSTEDLEAL